MLTFDFGQNNFTWRVNFRFNFLSNEDISNIIKKTLPLAKDFGINFIEDKTEENNLRSIQISDKRDKQSEPTKLIRVFNKGIAAGAGPGISYDEWSRIRSNLCLNILKDIDSMHISLIDALDAQFFMSIPAAKIAPDIYGSLFNQSSPMKSFCPFKDPKLLDLAIMLKDDIYRLYLGIDPEYKINEAPFVRFTIAFPLLEMPTDGDMEQVILNHITKVDSWIVDVVKSIILPLLKD